MSIDSVRDTDLIEIDPEMVGGPLDQDLRVLASDILHNHKAGGGQKAASEILKRLGLSPEDWSRASVEQQDGLKTVELVARVICAGMQCELINQIDHNRFGRAINERLMLIRVTESDK